jgi:hypothetical protein
MTEKEQSIAKKKALNHRVEIDAQWRNLRTRPLSASSKITINYNPKYGSCRMNDKVFQSVLLKSMAPFGR